jgi:outer membrane protein TolC
MYRRLLLVTLGLMALVIALPARVRAIENNLQPSSIAAASTTALADPSAALLARKAQRPSPGEVVKNNFSGGPLTLVEATKCAKKNYPAILKAQEEARAAQINITVRKLAEYMPESLVQTQDFLGSRNKITENFYGSPAFPALAGPARSDISMKALLFSGVGTSLDWAPLDFGLHKARIQLSQRLYDVSTSQAMVSVFDVELAAAAAYLDTLQSSRMVKAAEENVRSFEEFAKIVDAQVKALLKPAVDLSLAEAQLVNARNQLYRARLSLQTAEFSLANALGMPDTDFTVIDKGLANIVVKSEIQRTKPVFEQVPILQLARAQLLTTVAHKRVLEREWDPVIHWLAGWNQRGGAVTPGGVVTGRDGYGLGPATPNYQVALVINWNFLDIFRLRCEKKVQDHHIAAQEKQYELVLNNLKTLDKQSRARLQTAILVAESMPVEVGAAESAQKQAMVRYRVGLSSVAQVAEANQTLALARMQEAIANIGIWKAMLDVASAHGNLEPFLAEADRVQRM